MVNMTMAPFALWLTGLPASGKSSIVARLLPKLASMDMTAEVLESGGFAEEVRTDEETARDLDITGVPATVVDGRLLVPGAQEVATFARVLERAAASMR